MNGCSPDENATLICAKSWCLCTGCALFRVVERREEVSGARVHVRPQATRLFWLPGGPAAGVAGVADVGFAAEELSWIGSVGVHDI